MVYENDVNTFGLWLHRKGYFTDQNGLVAYWVVQSLVTTLCQIYFAGQLGYKYWYLLGERPEEFFDGDKEAAKAGIKEMTCGNTINSSISTMLVCCLLSKSLYQKAILICEAQNDLTGVYAKVILYIQIIIASFLTMTTYFYMQLDSAPES